MGVINSFVPSSKEADYGNGALVPHRIVMAYTDVPWDKMCLASSVYRTQYLGSFTI